MVERDRKRESRGTERIPDEKIQNLKDFIKEILTPDTTNGTWCHFCPEYRQSRTVSFLIREHFRGTILSLNTNKGTTHYWNLLPNGQEIDMTYEGLKYLGGLPPGEPSIVDEDWFIFAGSKAEEKYELLKSEADRVLKKRGMNTLWELVLD